jgi:hypothetical protein
LSLRLRRRDFYLAPVGLEKALDVDQGQVGRKAGGILKGFNKEGFVGFAVKIDLHVKVEQSIEFNSEGGCIADEFQIDAIQPKYFRFLVTGKGLVLLEGHGRGII